MKKTFDNFDWVCMDELTDVYGIFEDGSHKRMRRFHKEGIFQEIYINNQD